MKLPKEEQGMSKFLNLLVTPLDPYRNESVLYEWQIKVKNREGPELTAV